MKAVLITGKKSALVTDFPKPQMAKDEVLIQTRGCGVCGTDVLKYNWELVKKPTVLGHELVGQVVAVGEVVRDFSVGDTLVVAHHVPCFSCHDCRHERYSMCAQFKSTNLDPGGFAEFVKISAAHLKHTTFKVPATLDWQEALFTEPLACCVRNMDRLPLLAQDTVVVIGLGSIGLMMTKLLKRLSCTVVGIDLDPERSKMGLIYGADKVFTSTQDGDFLTFIKKTDGGRGCDGVIFTAGPAKLLNESLSWVRGGGFLNLFSHLSGDTATIDTALLYHHEIQMITTYSASPDSLKKAFEILRDENLGLRKMVAPAYAPEKLANAIEDINHRRILKAVVVF